MPHNPNQMLLGSTQSSFKDVDNRAGNISAGIAVRLKADETISIAAADGNLLGISLGRSLSNTSRTAIVRKGARVPVALTAAFTPTIGAQVHISDTTGLAVAAGAGATGVNAIYVSGILTGIDEDGTTRPVALIDMPGGL